jgi:hypothetical protein
VKLLGSDPAADAAVLHALAEVGAARSGIRVALDFDGPEPELVPFALAEVAAIALDEIDRLGGDSAALLRRIYAVVTRGATEGAGSG